MNIAKWEQHVLQRLQSDQAMTLDKTFWIHKEASQWGLCVNTVKHQIMSNPRVKTESKCESRNVTGSTSSLTQYAVSQIGLVCHSLLNKCHGNVKCVLLLSIGTLVWYLEMASDQPFNKTANECVWLTCHFRPDNFVSSMRSQAIPACHHCS